MNIDLEAFYKIIGRSIDVETKKEDDKNKLKVYEAAYPDYIINQSDGNEQVPSNVICYSTSTRDHAPLGSKTQIKLIPAARYENTDTGDVYTLLLRRYLDRIRFDCFAPTATETESLMIWFERFMDLRRSLLMHIGLEQCVYRGRGLTMTTFRSGYHNRSALYDIITEDHLWRIEKPINELLIYYGIDSTYHTDDVEPNFEDNFEYPPVTDETR